MQTLDLHAKKNEKFQPTPEELNAIKSKMDDPEFMKLWAEYAQELQDPKYRAEEEAYLRQIEQEAQEGGDYSFEFIFPEPVFAVRLQRTGKRGVCLNLCQSDKVEQFSESKTTDSNDASWHVPVVVGKPHDESLDSKDVDVYDCVFHSKTIGLANMSDRFMCFLVEIAVENINAGYSKSFGFEFCRLSEKSVGTPQNQTLRKKGTDSSFFPKSDEPPSAAPQRPQMAQEPATAQTNRPSAASEPTFTISHRGEVDLTDAWQWRTSEKRIGVPKELVVKFVLPKVSKAAELDVDVQEFTVEVVAEHAGYSLSVPLPFSVEETPSSAKFDKTRHELLLVLTVIPPQRPDPPVAATETADVTEVAAVTPAAERDDNAPDASSATEQPLTVCALETAGEEAASPSLPERNTESTLDSDAVDAPAGGKVDAVKDVMARVAEARRQREIAESIHRDAPPPEEAGRALDEAEKVTVDSPEVVDLRSSKPAVDAGPVVLDDEEEADPQAILAAQKKLRAERESERVAAELSKKMAELPLCSRHIFAIE